MEPPGKNSSFSFSQVLNLNFNKYSWVPVVYPGFRGWGVPGAMGGGTFLHWRNKKFSVFHTRKFQKI